MRGQPARGRLFGEVLQDTMNERPYSEMPEVEDRPDEAAALRP
jgi:hypothetical protein